MQAFKLLLSAALVAAPMSRPAVVQASSAAVASPAQARSLEVDYERSWIVAKLKKGGFLRFLGHEHGIVAGAWSAEVRYDAADLAASGIVVEIEVASLIVDSAAARRLAGVDPDGPSPSDIEEIEARMLSDEQLDATSFATIRFSSTSLQHRAENELRIDGTMTLRGVSREISVDATIEPVADGYVVRGGLAIGQRDFGIEPVSIGGVVNVANEVQIRFEVYAANPQSAGRS